MFRSDLHLEPSECTEVNTELPGQGQPFYENSLVDSTDVLS